MEPGECLKFDDLPEEVKKKAIEEWRDKGYCFDDHDAKDLTDFFKERLEEEGFQDGVDCWWSLGYCQGDGVCFQGSLDLDKFFEKEGWRTYKEIAPYISVQVKNHSHNTCHYASMYVEVEERWPDSEELMPEVTFKAMTDWRVKRDKMERAYSDEVQRIKEAREAPIREWQNRVRMWDDRRGVLEWLPDRPEKPAPLDIPLPPEPDYPDEPKRFAAAREKAKAKLSRFEEKVKQLEEDVKEWVEDMSRELEKIGYAEIEYKSSDENIIEIFQANNYEFDEDGAMC